MSHQPDVPQDPTTPPPPPTWSGQPYQAPDLAAQPAPQYNQPTYPTAVPSAPAGYGSAAPGQAPLAQHEARQWGMFAHLGGIILGFVAPLIIMLVFGPRDGFVKDQSTEALNFQITALIGYLASVVVAFILPLPLNLLVWVAVLVFSIMGGLAANRGEAYRYPFALRLVK